MILFMSSQCINKQYQDWPCKKQRVFPTMSTWQWSMNMIKVIWWRFHQCLKTFTMLLVRRFCQRGLLDIYLTTYSESVISEIKNLWGSYFVSNNLKFNLNFKNAGKNWEKLLSFWDTCIWIRMVKWSLLRTVYFSSAANVLVGSRNI